MVSHSFVSPQTSSLPGSSVHVNTPGKNILSGLLFLSPRGSSDWAIQPASPALLGGLFTTLFHYPGNSEKNLLLWKKKWVLLFHSSKFKQFSLNHPIQMILSFPWGFPRSWGLFLGASQVNDQVTHHFYDLLNKRIKIWDRGLQVSCIWILVTFLLVSLIN